MSIIWSKSLRRISLLLAALVVFAGLQAIPSALAATSVGVPGANPVPGDPLTGTGQVTRTLLTYSDLTTTQSPTAPVDNSAFAIPANAAMPTSTFEGTLTLNNVATSGGFQNIPLASPSQWGIDCATMCGQHLPPFTMDFVQNGSYLIPVTQTLVITHDLQGQADIPFKDSQESVGYNLATWNLLIQPGRCWSEVTDTGAAGTMSRCSVPFSLVAFDDWGHTSYGLLTFLYNSTKISNVRYQVVYETDIDAQFNMWGQLSATYAPHTVANDLAIANQESTTVQNKIPTKPIASLATDYPNSGIDVSVFTSGTTPTLGTIPASAQTVYGVVYNGVNYVGGCGTRFGPNPYCYEMRMTPNSSSKAMFTCLALAYLVKLYGQGILNAKIIDYVPGLSASSNWKNSPVTFWDLANMSSGNYFLNQNPAIGQRVGMPFGDESSAGWNTNVTYASKLSAAMDVGDAHPSEAGTTFSYMNTGMFILAQAETGFLQSKQGPNADLLNTMIKEVYGPMGIGPGLDMERTDNVSAPGYNASGQPIGRPFGAGSLWVTVDDVAKISMLFQNNGMANGVQLVDRTSMLSAMQRLTGDTGVNTIINDYAGPPGSGAMNSVNGGGGRYSRGVWSVPTANQYLSGCNFQVPYFSGHGGITVQMLPNGASYYMFDDTNGVIEVPAYIQLNKLSPMCGPTTTTVSSSYSTIGQNQSVSLKAQVISATRSWAPTGTVQFFDGGQTLSPNILLDANGTATYSVSTLSLGNHNITATFSPDLTNYSGINSSPAITSLSGICVATAITCSVTSTAGMKVGDKIAMGTMSGVSDWHIVSALTPTSISWIGPWQNVDHPAGEPVWVQDTAGGGFNASTSSGFTQIVQAEAVTTTTTTSTTTTTTTLPPTTTTTVAKVTSKTITCVKGKLTKKVTGTSPKCPPGYTLKK